MADFYPIEAPAATKPATKSPGNAVRAHYPPHDLDVHLAAQAIGDRLMLPRVPKGARGVHFRITPSVALGGVATIAIGIAGNVGKYRAAAIKNDARRNRVAKAAMLAAELAADEDPFLTVAAAALPGAGTLVVETIYSDD
jgi:hypothetical protein